MNEVVFTYQRTKKDLLSHSLWHRMIRSKFSLALNIIFPTFGIVALISTLIYGGDTIQYAASIYLMCYPLITYSLTKLKINSIFKNPDVVFDVTTYTYNVAGINTSSDKGAFLLTWDQIFKIYETKGYFYIYFDKQNSLVVNKEFVGEEKAKIIKEIFLANAPAESIKFK